MKFEITHPKIWKAVNEKKIPMKHKIQIYEKLGGAYRFGQDGGEQVYNKMTELLKSKLNEGPETQDHEVSMANNTLDAIIKHATELKSKIGGNEKDIPAWIQDHITNAGNFISQAAENYHEYGTNESKQQIKEATVKFDFAQANGVQFYVSSPNNNIVLLPQSRKEIEKIDMIKQKLGDGSDEDFLPLLKIRLEKKLGVTFL